MIIKCYRCGKEIETPNSSNADYAVADDMIAKEPRETLIALKENQRTLVKGDEIVSSWWEKESRSREKERKTNPDIAPLPADTRPTKDYIRSQFSDDEYDAIEVPDLPTAQRQFGEDLVKVIVEVREKDIQKTGIICPNCYKDTDFLIWGVHKTLEAKEII